MRAYTIASQLANTEPECIVAYCRAGIGNGSQLSDGKQRGKA